MIWIPFQILIELLNQYERDEQGMWHIWETGKVHTGFW